jgi:hypothetical protein
MENFVFLVILILAAAGVAAIVIPRILRWFNLDDWDR